MTPYLAIILIAIVAVPLIVVGVTWLCDRVSKTPEPPDYWRES